VARVLASNHDFKTDHQFVRVIGFRQIVVAARAQATHFFIDVGQRTDHQDGQVDLGLPQQPDHHDSVCVGQLSIERHGVVSGGTRCAQRLAPARNEIDLEAAFTQRLGDLRGRVRMVPDRQDAPLP
jgi:hypothetical protein